jgi:toxin HigB-1
VQRTTNQLTTPPVVRYTTYMIKSFSDKCTEQIFNGQRIKKLDANLQKKALRRLRYIDAAIKIDDLRVPPSNKFGKKEGNLRDFYAIWVDNQWRIIFKWIDNDAHDVLLIDYH